MFDHNEPKYKEGDMAEFFLPKIQQSVKSFQENKTMMIVGMEGMLGFPK